MAEKIRALALLSGGLDSTLAVRIIQDLGVGVTALHFNTGFCLSDNREKIRQKPGEIYRNDAAAAAERLGVPLETVDIYDEYWEVLTRPKHGYGSAMNPCIDCRAMMLRIAGRLLRERGEHFVFTGEVVGQRPMSQQRHTLRLIEKECGLEGLLLRPLSAKLLEPTTPEKEGWVDREKLYGFAGRGRKNQMELAAKLGIEEYPSPAGGCCSLVDPIFAQRLMDLLTRRTQDDPLAREEVYLLKVGRHFRLSPKAKVIVARDEGECRFIHFHRRSGWRIEADEIRGPVGLVQGDPSEEDLRAAAAIVASYGDGKNERSVPVLVDRGGEIRVVDVAPMAREDSRPLWVG
ncbi:MAG: hypothetical protein ABIK65_03060 [Candidatus Eisenbacteria bacterium]